MTNKAQWLIHVDDIFWVALRAFLAFFPPKYAHHLFYTKYTFELKTNSVITNCLDVIALYRCTSLGCVRTMQHREIWSLSRFACRWSVLERFSDMLINAKMYLYEWKIFFYYNLLLNITYKLYSALSQYISCQFCTAGSYFMRLHLTSKKKKIANEAISRSQLINNNLLASSGSRRPGDFTFLTGQLIQWWKWNN